MAELVNILMQLGIWMLYGCTCVCILLAYGTEVVDLD